VAQARAGFQLAVVVLGQPADLGRAGELGEGCLRAGWTAGSRGARRPGVATRWLGGRVRASSAGSPGPPRSAPVRPGPARSAPVAGKIRPLIRGLTGSVVPGGLGVLLVSCPTRQRRDYPGGSGLPGASRYPPGARILPGGPILPVISRAPGREGRGEDGGRGGVPGGQARRPPRRLRAAGGRRPRWAHGGHPRAGLSAGSRPGLTLTFIHAPRCYLPATGGRTGPIRTGGSMGVGSPAAGKPGRLRAGPLTGPRARAVRPRRAVIMPGDAGPNDHACPAGITRAFIPGPKGRA
jgi:hypothetical protein